MDSRTKKKLLGKASLLMHLIQEHHGVIPAGADYAEILRDGQDAITALALPMVVRQASRVKPSAPVEPLRVGWGVPTDAEVEEVMQDPAVTNLSRWHVEGEQWGIGRGLPTGDVL